MNNRPKRVPVAFGLRPEAKALLKRTAFEDDIPVSELIRRVLSKGWDSYCEERPKRRREVIR